MNNSDKQALLRYRLAALEKEEETLGTMVTIAKLTMIYQSKKNDFKHVAQLIDAGKQAIGDELTARGKNIFQRKKAVKNLRAQVGKQGLYGFHKVANVDLETIRTELDKFEDLLEFDLEDAVMLYNLMAKRWEGDTPLPKASVIPKIDQYDNFDRVALGSHMEVPYKTGSLSLGSNALKKCEAFQIQVLRMLRRLIQTAVGQAILLDLDATYAKLWRTKFESKPKSRYLLQILLGSSNQDWCCGAWDGKGATKRGKPTAKSVPSNSKEKQGKERGTGVGSSAYVKTFPEHVIKIGPSQNHVATAWIPTHVALYHELTHALHAARGEQDHTWLSEKPSALGQTFAHSGSWYTQEEKNTVAAEAIYSQQCGFTMKRTNYGQLGTRIDD